MSKCINCETEIEANDNFCWKCGHWTPKGYTFLKNDTNVKKIINGDALKQTRTLTTLICLLSFIIILFISITVVKNNSIFEPYIYLKKQINNYKYGYNTSMIKTDNKYNKEVVNTYNDAISIIKKDFEEQSWLCQNDIDVSRVEYELQDKFLIPSVSFCDVPYNVVSNIKDVIIKMYDLFPSIKGVLTNITITNSSAKNSIAYFQALYQFVNINEDVSLFNKVNKTQILLNSYYFLNEDIMNNSIEEIVGKNWYVNDATWQSTIAHELGHLVSFAALLKENNIDNITLVNSDNYAKIENIIEIYNAGTFSYNLLNEALKNYNNKYNVSLDINLFASSVSNYANIKDKNNNLIADETIAEAIHDYYLHGSNMKDSSREIINIINNVLLGGI